jgi:hypothetical protein
MRQLFEDQDLRELNVRLSQHELAEQIELLAKSGLDLAAAVMGKTRRSSETLSINMISTLQRRWGLRVWLSGIHGLNSGESLQPVMIWNDPLLRQTGS